MTRVVRAVHDQALLRAGCGAARLPASRGPRRRRWWPWARRLGWRPPRHVRAERPPRRVHLGARSPSLGRGAFRSAGSRAAGAQPVRAIARDDERVDVLDLPTPQPPQHTAQVAHAHEPRLQPVEEALVAALGAVVVVGRPGGRADDAQRGPQSLSRARPHQTRSTRSQSDGSPVSSLRSCCSQPARSSVSSCRMRTDALSSCSYRSTRCSKSVWWLRYVPTVPHPLIGVVLLRLTCRWRSTPRSR